MDKILKIDKIFNQKILNHNQNIFFNHSTNLLINIISNNIKEIILEYHFIEISELEHLKNKLVINLLKFRNKNYYDIELTNICVELLQLVSEINYQFKIDYSLNSPNSFSNFNKNIGIKLYHKSYSIKMKNNLYKNSYTILSPILSNTINDDYPNLHIYPYIYSDSDSDSESDEQNIYFAKQRKIIKNKSLNNSIDNNIKQSIMKINENKILNKNILMIKKNPKEYKIVSKNVSFDWEKSFISI